jgi:hypothetical protein
MYPFEHLPAVVCRAWATRGSPVTRTGMGLGKNLDPSRVVGFLTGEIFSHGHGFGMAKPSGFVPVAIYTPGAFHK